MTNVAGDVDVTESVRRSKVEPRSGACPIGNPDDLEVFGILPIYSRQVHFMQSAINIKG